MRDVSEWPAVDHAGVPSVVCTRFGSNASLNRAIIGPVAFRSAARTGLPSVLPDHDARQASAQVLAAGCERQDRHDLRSCCDEKAAGTIAAVTLLLVRCRHADGDVAQRAIIHVQRARPGDAVGIEVQFIAVEDVRIDQRGQKVVGGGDGMKVTVEVKIDFLRRLHLRAATAGCAALHAKDRA